MSGAARGRRVCFVTCATWPDVSASDVLAKTALEWRGVAVDARPWNGPEPSFEGFDALILRSSWDYHHAIDAFAAGLDALDAAGVRVWNPTRLVRWNLSKRYLLELAAMGVPTVPTVVLEDDAARQLPRTLTERGWPTAVVKPMVSASAHDTVLVTDRDIGRVTDALAAGTLRRPVLVQPFVEEIQTRGEWSIIFIEGVLTHTVLKRPGPGDFRVQGRFGGTAMGVRAEPAVVAAARQALDALPVAPLYARIDGVETREGFQVMEVEVHEPGLLFTLAPEAAETFADAVCRRLEE